MPIRVQCPQCGKEYNVGDDKAGRRFQCKGCQAPVVVPTSSAAAEDDPFGGMDEDFGNDMAQPARPGGAKSASLSKKGKGKGKKSKQSGGNGALLGIGIGAAAIVIVATVVFFFTRGNGGDDPAPPANGGSGGNVAANTPAGHNAPTNTVPGGGDTTSSAPSGSTDGATPMGASSLSSEVRNLSSAEVEAVKRNLHQLALGFHNFHEAYGSLPVPNNLPADRRNTNGAPYLSWRVYLLPFLDEGDLYNQFHFNEPWNSPHNLPLADQMPDIYRTPGDAQNSNTTQFVVFTGQGAPFGNAGPRFADFRDGLSNTILAAHASSLTPIPWTKPEDVNFDANDPLGCIGGIPPWGLPVVMGDGAPRFVSPSVDAATFSHLVQYADLNVIDGEILQSSPVSSFQPPATPPSGPLHLAYMTDDCIGLVRIAPQQLMQASWIMDALPPDATTGAPVPLENLEEVVVWADSQAFVSGPSGPESQFALSFSQPTAIEELNLSYVYDGNIYPHGDRTFVFANNERFEQMFSGSGSASPLAAVLRADQMDADVYMAYLLQSESFSVDWSDVRPVLQLSGDLGIGLMDAEQLQLAFRANESPLLKLWLTFPETEMANNYARAVEQQLPLLIQSQSRDPIAGNLMSLLADAWSVTTEGATVSFEVEHSEELTTEIASVVAAAVVQPAITASAEVRARNNFHQLLLASHNYADVNRTFPVSSQVPQALDEDGKPFLSWRVHLLQYIDPDLYAEFHLNEPWDSEHNQQLLERMPDVYHIEDADAEELEPGMTRVVRVDGPGMLFENGIGGGFNDITDGSSNTAFCFAVGPDKAVPWTKPEDIAIDFTKPIIPQLGLDASETFMVGMCDGSVRDVPVTIDNEMLRRLLIHNDGEVIQFP